MKGLITERETRLMTWEEQVQWVMKYTDVEWENLYIVEEVYKDTTPTKIVTTTTKDGSGNILLKEHKYE
jgi:hypothetical protein